MKARRKAREIALTFLYQWDMRGEEVLPEMDEILVRDRRSEEVSDYVKLLVRGVIAESRDIDKRISDAAEHWSLHRMALVDRNILRMAIWEMGWRKDDIPAKVAINEAIEMAKRFSTEQSGAFVNGVLDRVRRNMDL